MVRGQSSSDENFLPNVILRVLSSAVTLQYGCWILEQNPDVLKCLCASLLSLSRFAHVRAVSIHGRVKVL